MDKAMHLQSYWTLGFFFGGGGGGGSRGEEQWNHRYHQTTRRAIVLTHHIVCKSLVPVCTLQGRDAHRKCGWVGGKMRFAKV